MVEDDTREVLKVDLVHDTATGRHNLEVIEGLATPFEELEALAIALEFHLLVELCSVEGAGGVDLHRVVNDKIHGTEGVDLFGIAAQTLHGVAHSGQIHDGGHTAKNERVRVRRE